MYLDNQFYIGDSMITGEKVAIKAKYANRHGLITGATGTGKTTTLKTMAESFSDAGIPVFLCDVKGDLAGLGKTYPASYWDIYGKNGIPTRTTISEMGPVLLTKLMDLNDTQADILTVVFKIADDQGLLLIDTKDLKSMLSFVAENADEFAADYGHIAKASVNTILRNIVAIESKGGEQFFGEPALNIADWFVTEGGKGKINILDCRELIADTTMYSTFLLWMLSELYETLPEVGDLDKPRMVLFFDEAHVIFKDMSKALKSKIEQVVKLIRSKGVGLYFISQVPKDIPDEVLAQLGNKVQHGLRAYTPSDEKNVKAVAESLRTNPAFNTYETLLNLGTGEALVSTLGDGAIPNMVEKVKILAPASMDDNMDLEEQKRNVLLDNLYLRYKDMYDRDSAYEFLQRLNAQRAESAREAAEEIAAQKAAEKEAAKAEKEAEKAAEKAEKEAVKAELAAQKAAEKEALAAQKAAEKEAAQKKKAVKQVASSAAGTIGREVGKSIGSVGGKFGKTLGGNVGAQLGRSILGTFLK